MNINQYIVKHFDGLSYSQIEDEDLRSYARFLFVNRPAKLIEIIGDVNAEPLICVMSVFTGNELKKVMDDILTDIFSVLRDDIEERLEALKEEQLDIFERHGFNDLGDFYRFLNK
jgi:hypothetical protein